MERYGIDSKGASKVLKLVSASSQVNLFHVAEEVVATRRTPTDQVAPPLAVRPEPTLDAGGLEVDSAEVASATLEHLHLDRADLVLVPETQTIGAPPAPGAIAG